MDRKPLVVGLAASLALNVFLIGGLAGAGLMGWRLHAFGREPHPRPGMGAVGQVLPQPERQAWRAALHDQNQVSGPKLRQARMLRRGAWLKLGADPFDPKAVLADLQQSRDLEMQGRGEIDQAVVNFAAGLPAADRAKFGEALSQITPPPQAQRRPGSSWGSGRHAVGADEAQPRLPNR